MGGFLLPAIISGIGAIGGALGNSGKPTQSSGTQNTTSNQSSSQQGTTGVSTSGTTTPTYDATGGALKDLLAKIYTQNISDLPQTAENITTQSMQNNNAGSAIQQRLAQQMLAAKGLNYSPASAVLGSNINNQRVATNVQLQNAQPLLQQNLLQQALSGASGFFRSLPYGTSTTGDSLTQTSGASSSSGTQNTSQTGTVTPPNNSIAGGALSLANLLAGLYGQGAFQGSGGSNNNTPLSPSNPAWSIGPF